MFAGGAVEPAEFVVVFAIGGSKGAIAEEVLETGLPLKGSIYAPNNTGDK